MLLLLSGQPVGNGIWIALAWCVGIMLVAYIFALRSYKKRVSFYIHTDAYTDENVGMGIGMLISAAMILKSTIDMLASVDDKEIITVSNLVQETFEYLVQFQMVQRDRRPNI